MVNYLLQITPDSVINELERLFAMSIAIELVKEAIAASCKEDYFELVKYLTKWHIVDCKEATQLARYSDNLHIVKYLLTVYNA